MAMGIKDKVAIIGMGCTHFGERWDVGAEELMVEAFTECLEDARIERNEIQAAWLGTCIERHQALHTAAPDALLTLGACRSLLALLEQDLDHGSVLLGKGDRFTTEGVGAAALVPCLPGQAIRPGSEHGRRGPRLTLSTLHDGLVSHPGTRAAALDHAESHRRGAFGERGGLESKAERRLPRSLLEPSVAGSQWVPHTLLLNRCTWITQPQRPAPPTVAGGRDAAGVRVVRRCAPPYWTTIQT